MPKKKLITIIKDCLEEMKAQDTVILDIKDKSSIADKIQRTLKTSSYKNIKVEGLQNCDWVLIDALDVIVNIFKPEVREFYMIEKIWSENLVLDTKKSLGT